MGHHSHAKAGPHMTSIYFCIEKSFHVAAGSALQFGVAWGDQAPEGPGPILEREYE